jgi:hypothetical protein
MFRFSIRELSLLTVSAAVALGWMSDRRSLASDRAFLASLIKIDGDVYLDSGGELDGLPGTVYLKPPTPTTPIPGQRPRF